jgi:murein DD-endopeptidase MepM/ murein hydrolase activator NlpD
MKRNKLIDSSAQSGLFSLNKPKKYHLVILSFFALAGIFITSIVLATSSQTIVSTDSQVIDLPGLSIEMQTLTSPSLIQNSSSIIALPAIEPKKEVFQAVDKYVITDELALQDQIQIEQLAVNEPIEEISALNWQEVTVKSGDNLSLIFPRVGLTARDVYNVAQLGKDIKPLLNLKPGQTLRFGFSPESSDKNTLEQLELQLSQVSQLQLTATDTGYEAITLTRDIEYRQTHAVGEIKSSLFEAGQEAGLSDKLIMELAYIFGWDIDFALDLRKGDNFKLLYDENFLDGDKIADGDILAAEFTNRGKTFQAVRYTDESGLSRFYAPNGDSMRKAFSRTPVHFSRISSRFNPNRKHPVLKTSRPHRGVDYAASRGTPILATGDGKVHFVGTKGGYGRTVILTHGGKYTTLYAHMSKYRKGIKRGKRVQQGDTIGYIGSSGLATGPHLHYEFRVNGVHRNPLTVSLPKAQALATKYQADFKVKMKPLLASLDTLNNTALALNE